MRKSKLWECDMMIEFCEDRVVNADRWEEIIEKLGLLQKLKSAKTIAIKPNLAAGTKADPKRHVCTDMAFIKNVAELCRGMNPEARIFVAEGDSTGDGFAYLKFEHFDLPRVADPDGSVGLETLDLSRDRLKQIEDPRFLYFGKGENLWLAESLVDADFSISLSNLKTHSVTLYTGACKNLFGALPASVKSVYHPYIHEVVHDLTLALAPDLNIVDAFYAMEKNGPVGGLDVDGGVRLFSADALEADYYGAMIAGIAPRNVAYLNMLARDLGTPNVDADLVRKYAFNVKTPDSFLRFCNAIGLWVQRAGSGIAATGDRVHIARTPARVVIAVLRPLLIKIFGLKKLKSMKNKVEGE